jgi:hypothetical protein
MTAEDRLRDAYRDVAARATRDVDPGLDTSAAPSTGPSGGRRGGRLRGPGLVMAGLALIVAAGVAIVALTGDDGDQQVATDDLTTTTGDGTGDGSVGATTDPTADDTTDGSTTDGTDPDGIDGTDGEDGDRYRVATGLVEADTADPFLNVRLEPDAGAGLLAKLPATYTGLVATGRAETAPDGGDWLEVELRHPVAVTTVDRDRGRPPAGWVNAAFVEPLRGGLAVTVDEVPPCAGGFDPIDTGPGIGPGYLYALESGLVEPGCLRVVLTFAEGQTPFEWLGLSDRVGPADGLPDLFTAMSGGLGARVELGRVDGAWPGATDTGDGIYAARSSDRSIDLVTARAVDGVTLTGLPERGIAVIDLEFGAGTTPPAGAGVVLTQPVRAGSGTIEVVGLARPFEATLGVRIEDDGGRPVEAVYSGSDFLGTVATDEYGVGTTDWVEAWGHFAVRAEGLPAGDYTLVLDGEGAGEDPDTLRLPVALDEGGDRPALATPAQQEAAMALISFARGGDADRVPLADQVVLALGPDVFATASATELADRDGWTADVADGFGGFDGPFNALDQLQRTALRFTAGPVPHCAGPPRDWPAQFDGLDQVNIEPVGVDSCIDWFGVHLFLDQGGDIVGVSLDLFGP